MNWSLAGYVAFKTFMAVWSLVWAFYAGRLTLLTLRRKQWGWFLGILPLFLMEIAFCFYYTLNL